MKHFELNHVAIHVSDVDRSSGWYQRVLQLPPIPRPAFTFPGAWFRLGDFQELHLIGGRAVPVVSHNRGTHFALRIDSMDEWESYLSRLKEPYLPRRVRPDGAYQIYLTDPDGHVIELCEVRK